MSVIVELKARLDEARNIAWARSLERVGIHVVTGLVSLKTHAKLALVVRRQADGRVRRYAHLGTGNYNADTARVYADVGLFTADPRITADVHALFNELTGSSHAPRVDVRHLMVAPTNLLERLLALIDREAGHARAGRPARIRAKLNALSDSTVIQALYRASQAGGKAGPHAAAHPACQAGGGSQAASSGRRPRKRARPAEGSRPGHAAGGRA